MHYTRVWVLTDGHAGNEKQALALTQRLGFDAPDRIVAKLRGPSRLLAPHLWRGRLSDLKLSPSLEAVPDLLIGCGRVSAVALDALKRAHPRTRTVQILHPRCDLNRYDVLLIPEHDRAKGENVVQLCGAIHSVDADWLAQGKTKPLQPRPEILILLGGPTAHAQFTGRELGKMLTDLPLRSLAITCSRRTPTDLCAIVEDFVKHRRAYVAQNSERLADNEQHVPRLWRGPEDGENPYQMWLSQSEEVWVTPDSVNMISEAYASGAQVRVLWPETTSGKLKRFVSGAHRLQQLDALTLAVEAIKEKLDIRIMQQGSL